MKHYSNKLLALIVLVTIVLSSCNTSDDPEVDSAVATPSTLVSADAQITWRSGDLRGFMNQAGIDIDLDAIQYDVTIYHITYKTIYKGDSIIASGVVYMPSVDDEVVSTVSFQHGTIGSDAEAPSNLALGDGQNILLSALASTGLVAIAPDFIGFGSSVDIMHPYYLEDLTATAVVNAIYASREVASMEEVEIDNELYLAGYSQGGYATMASHKYYEENDVPYYDMKASFAASGGYDIKAFQEYFFAQETYHQPFFMAFVAQAYVESLDMGDLADFFNEPYASDIPDYFDGSMTGSQINAQLTDVVADLVNNDLLENIDSKDEYAYIREAFVDNSPIDFVPEIPLFMYHGDADITVPYQNSVDVYNQFIANGASTEVVTFTTIEGGTHGTGVLPYLEELASQLLKMEQE
ncbi:alpha/beta hydrolase family protein [Marinoscillum pacificum]|uniref:alpha/beta hydrolase family protein n=1 Tax=Marinoscillum pacificum TaxID=392723 RepID=UPI00215899D4|nr:lipase family protein [Marinoscillum pacificum]